MQVTGYRSGEGKNVNRAEQESLQLFDIQTSASALERPRPDRGDEQGQCADIYFM